MEGKVLGIPLVLIVLVALIALLIDVPMVALQTANQKRMVDLQNDQLNTTLQLQRMQAALVTPTETPLMAVTPTPTKTGVRTITNPATTSGQIVK